MGQRLNFEIVNSKKGVLANGYYHWAGFTRSALNIACQGLSRRDELEKGINVFQEFEDIDKAVEILKYTGAGFAEKELQKAINLGITGMLARARGRSEGLISVSEEGKNETRYWEECRVTLNIDTGKINADLAFWTLEDREIEEHKLSIKNINAFTEIRKLTDLTKKEVEDLILKLEQSDNGYFRYSGKIICEIA